MTFYDLAGKIKEGGYAKTIITEMTRDAEVAGETNVGDGLRLFDQYHRRWLRGGSETTSSALLLNELRSMKFKKISQTISYLPHFLSSVIIVTMLQRILAPNTGVLNQAIAALGGDGSTFFLMDAKYFYRILFSMDLWRNIGWDSIMYLAAISSVDLTLYEAAEMDGCGKLKKMWHITLPGIRGTIGLLFIMGVGGLLSSGVEQVWLLRTPGNMSLADTLDVYVLRMGIQGGQFGYATAIGLIQGVVGLVLVVVCNRICKKVTEVGLW